MFSFINRSHNKLARLQEMILASDDRTLKTLIDRHGIRKSGADAAALILKLLPLERSNFLLRDLPRKRLKEAIARLKDETPIDERLVERMLSDLRQGASRTDKKPEPEKTSDSQLNKTPIVIRALDLAGRFFGR